MKKVLLLSIACLMAVSSFGFEIIKTGYKMNFTITSSTDHEVKLTGVSNTSSSVVDLYDIPETVEYEGEIYTVTRICKDALQNGKYNNVIIPKTIKTLETMICAGVPFDLPSPNQLYDNCRTFNTLYYKAISASAAEGPFAPNFRNLVIEDGVIDIPSQLTYGYYHYRYNAGSTAIHTARSGNILIQSLSFPNSVRTIGSKAFYECGVKDITLGNSISSIGSNAFYGCNNLTSIKFPKSINTIGNNAFQYCTSLRTIEFMETRGPILIGSQAFSNCDSLRTIKLARNIISIGSSAFSGCEVLENVYNYCPIPVVISEGTFNNKPSTAVLHVPKGSADLYRAATEWKTFIIIDDLDIDNSNYNDENGETVSSSAFVEVNGVLWAKGNLQYLRNNGDPNFYDSNFRIAPAQWHYFGYDDEDFTVGDTCVMSSSEIDYFNWAVTGLNASSYTQYSTISDKNVQGKMFTNADGTDETTNFSESKYGDLAYWASDGVYQYPSYQDFDKLRHSAVKLIKIYKTDSGKEIKGVYFSDIKKQYGEYLSDSDLELGVFLPFIGYRKGNSTDIYQKEEYGYYQCIAQDSLGNQQFYMYPKTGTNQYYVTFINPRQNMHIGFPIRPILAINSSTIVGTCNSGGKVAIDDKEYSDEYFRHQIFKDSNPVSITTSSGGYKSYIFLNNSIVNELSEISLTENHHIDSLMVVFYSNDELVSWSTNKYTLNNFNPKWQNNAIGYDVTADLSSLDSSLGSHNVTIPFTFSRDGFSQTIDIEYSYEILPNSESSVADYELYTNEHVIFCTAHQPVEIPVYLRNKETVSKIDIELLVDGMSFTGILDSQSNNEIMTSENFEPNGPYLIMGERAQDMQPVQDEFHLIESGANGTSGIDMIMTGTLAENDGELLRLVMIPPKSGVFTTNQSMHTSILTLSDESEVELPPLSFRIVAERIEGDLNDDGMVDENDIIGGNVFGINLNCGDIALGVVNEDTEVPVKVKNSISITGLSFTIKLPERIQMVYDVESFISAGERGENFDFTATQNDDGTITITGTATTPLEAGEGPVLNLKVKTSWQNTYTIPVTNMTVTTADGTVKQLPDSETKLVMQGTRGDMNGDGRVDLSDALYIINLATGLAE